MLKYNPSSLVKAVLGTFIGVCFLGQSTTLFAASKTYYVATTGNDSNPGTIGSPFLTVQRGANALTCGDTLLIRGGVYNGGMAVIYGTQATCTSWLNAVTVSGYPDEVVILTNVTSNTVVAFATDSWPTERDIYWILRDVILDATGITEAAEGFAGSYVRLQNVEMRNSENCALLVHGSHWDLLNLNVHHNGFGSPKCHGIYLTGAYNLIDGGSYHDNYMYGIQIYDSGSTIVSNNIVRNTRIYRNDLARAGGGGIVISSGQNNVVYNNLIYNNGQYGLQMGSGSFNNDQAAYNNTIFGNDGGLVITGGNNRAVVKNNIVFGNSNVAINNIAINSILSNNLTGNPLFTNAAIGDFTLQPTSSAIDAGVDLRSIFVTDFAGKLRPAGATFDLGAYESGAAPALDTVPPTAAISVAAQ